MILFNKVSNKIALSFHSKLVLITLTISFLFFANKALAQDTLPDYKHAIALSVTKLYVITFRANYLYSFKEKYSAGLLATVYTNEVNRFPGYRLDLIGREYFSRKKHIHPYVQAKLVYGSFRPTTFSSRGTGNQIETLNDVRRDAIQIWGGGFGIGSKILFGTSGRFIFDMFYGVKACHVSKNAEDRYIANRFSANTVGDYNVKRSIVIFGPASFIDVNLLLGFQF
ncbi:MAG TPA: hypothetical protein VF691_07525 [Cytophagaceae bacterium]|jgi:hypothetical protein